MPYLVDDPRVLVDDPNVLVDGESALQREDAPSFVGSTALRLYNALGSAFHAGDRELGYPLLWFCYAITRTLAEVDRIVRDSDAGVGWSSVLDVDQAQRKDLPFLAQFIGARVDPRLSTADQREEIRKVKGFQRGTPEAIKAAARPTLSGTRTVILTERDGSPYRFRVQTYSFETPNPTSTFAALLRAKPAGLVMVYETPNMATWAQVQQSFSTWADVKQAFTSWDALKRWVP